MYTPTQFLEAIRDPRRAFLEANRLYHRKIRGQSGVKITEKDWDNLIILDACRYDLFRQVNTLDGELRPVLSCDSSTSGFLRYNFGDDTFADTVYVTANPQVQRHEIGTRFLETKRLWETHWDDSLKTVPPDDVTDEAIRTSATYPDKRLIVHYIQPHYPFIGETGRQIEHGSITGDGVLGTERDASSVWEQLENDLIDRDVVWRAYRENLELALPDVERLVESLQGKTVVTSDHGNSFGELGVYGHPGGTFIRSLVKVPWLTIDSGGRKTITPGEITTTDETDDSASESTMERLEDLGYV